MAKIQEYRGQMGKQIGELLGQGIKGLHKKYGPRQKNYREYLTKTAAANIGVPEDKQKMALSYDAYTMQNEPTYQAKKIKDKYGEKAGLNTAYEKFIEGEKTKTTSTKIKSSILGGGTIGGGETTFDSDYITPEGEVEEGAYQKWLETDEAKGLLGDYKKGPKNRKNLKETITDSADITAIQDKSIESTQEISPVDDSSIQSIIREQNQEISAGKEKELADPWAATKASGAKGFLQRALPGGETGWNDPKQEWLDKQFKTGPLAQYIAKQWASNPLQAQYNPLTEQQAGNDLDSPDALGHYGLNINNINPLQQAIITGANNQTPSLGFAGIGGGGRYNPNLGSQ